MQHELSEEVTRRMRELCDQGERVVAAKWFVEQTGRSVKEAKQWIDRYEIERSTDTHVEAQTDEFREVKSLLGRGDKIRAIKAYRQITGCSLLEAKTQIEVLETTGKIQRPSDHENSGSVTPVVQEKGCIGIFLVIVIPLLVELVS
jgi:ribosomal protein L7/L12